VNAIVALAVTGATGALSTGGGVWLNWKLSNKSAEKERQHRQREAVRATQNASAKELDTAVLAATKIVPLSQVEPSADVAQVVNKAQDQLLDAWNHAAVLHGTELADRYFALDATLFLAKRDCVTLGSVRPGARPGSGRPGDATTQISFWPLHLAFSDLHRGLASFQQSEPPPPLDYFTRAEVWQLSNECGPDDSAINHIYDAYLDREVAKGETAIVPADDLTTRTLPEDQSEAEDER
jgi:hypothetical protein